MRTLQRIVAAKDLTEQTVKIINNFIFAGGRCYVSMPSGRYQATQLNHVRGQVTAKRPHVGYVEVDPIADIDLYR